MSMCLTELYSSLILRFKEMDCLNGFLQYINSSMCVSINQSKKAPGKEWFTCYVRRKLHF